MSCPLLETERTSPIKAVTVNSRRKITVSGISIKHSSRLVNKFSACEMMLWHSVVKEPYAHSDRKGTSPSRPRFNWRQGHCWYTIHKLHAHHWHLFKGDPPQTALHINLQVKPGGKQLPSASPGQQESVLSPNWKICTFSLGFQLIS